MRRFLAGADIHVSTWTMDNGPRAGSHPEDPRPGERQGGFGGKVIEGEFDVVDEPANKRRPDADQQWRRQGTLIAAAPAP